MFVVYYTSPLTFISLLKKILTAFLKHEFFIICNHSNWDLQRRRYCISNDLQTPKASEYSYASEY